MLAPILLALLVAADPLTIMVPHEPELTLPAQRRALKTKVFGPRGPKSRPPRPPASIFELVDYPAPLGRNAAYVTPVRPGPRRPAVLWVHGGFIWGIDPGFWEPAERSDDQTAAAFRKAGLALMIPSFRGVHGNPGRNECFLGEVDDVLAAADFLAKRPDVDPDRIYLAGHSTGAVVALLAAESTTRFRAVFAFGPVTTPLDYGEAGCLPSSAPDSEVNPRSPIAYLSQIRTPTFIIEGDGRGNADVFPYLRKAQGSAPITFVEVPRASHFTVLAPGTEVVAAAILGAGAGPVRLEAKEIVARMKLLK